MTIKIEKKVYEHCKLLPLGDTITNDGNVEKNRKLFDEPVAHILYEISGKHKTYPKDYNKVLIEEIYKNKNCKDI